MDNNTGNPANFCPANCGGTLNYSNRLLYVENSDRTIGRLHTWACDVCAFYYNYKMSEFEKLPEKFPREYT